MRAILSNGKIGYRPDPIWMLFDCKIWSNLDGICLDSKKNSDDLKNWLNRNRTINISYLCNLGDIDSIIDNGEYYAAWV